MSAEPASLDDLRRIVDEFSKFARMPEPDRREGDPPALYADASKVRRELGWVPRYDTLDSIVLTACNWHLARPKGYAS